MHCRPDSNEDLRSLARLAEALTVKVSCLFFWEGKRKRTVKGKNFTKKKEKRNQNETGISVGSPK